MFIMKHFKTGYILIVSTAPNHTISSIVTEYFYPKKSLKLDFLHGIDNTGNIRKLMQNSKEKKYEIQITFSISSCFFRSIDLAN